MHHLITLVAINTVFAFSLIWMAVFLVLAAIVLVVPQSNSFLFLVVTSNKAIESLLMHTTSTDVDSIVDIARNVVYATNSLCWMYTNEITVLMLMYNLFLHPDLVELLLAGWHHSNQQEEDVVTSPIELNSPSATDDTEPPELEHVPSEHYDMQSDQTSDLSAPCDDWYVFDPVFGVIPRETRDLWRQQATEAGDRRDMTARGGIDKIRPVRYSNNARADPVQPTIRGTGIISISNNSTEAVDVVSVS